jgi:hypothetical protein
MFHSILKEKMYKITKLPNGGELYEWPNGDKEWYLNGKRHRKDGPAIEFTNGDKVWMLNDQFHREDGPAIDFVNGKEWWLNGQQIPCTTQNQFLQLMKLKGFW